MRTAATTTTTPTESETTRESRREAAWRACEVLARTWPARHFELMTEDGEDGEDGEHTITSWTDAGLGIDEITATVGGGDPSHVLVISMGSAAVHVEGADASECVRCLKEVHEMLGDLLTEADHD